MSMSGTCDRTLPEPHITYYVGTLCACMIIQICDRKYEAECTREIRPAFKVRTSSALISGE